MTGPAGRRVYLDWNATAPLRPEARAAMLSAMDAVGNPSSVHAEGRAARAIVERARGQVAALVGCEPSEVVFTSGATEAAAMVAAQCFRQRIIGVTEHDAVLEQLALDGSAVRSLSVDRSGRADAATLADLLPSGSESVLVALQAANGETGTKQPLEEIVRIARAAGAATFVDMTQVAGKVNRRDQFEFNWEQHRPELACLSAHKVGGPKGVGALVVRGGVEIGALVRGGGQERGQRSGTENVPGIAGFGAAAESAAAECFDDFTWERVSQMRDALEERLESAAPDLILVGKGAPRLPNTSCFAVPGWAGETQVMLMDLAGFAVSAGSACSSGKVRKASRVMLAMGFDEVTAASAVRVSMGPTTAEAEVMAFADAWIDRYRRRNSRAA